MPPTNDLTFLKLGGELLEPGDGLDAVLASIAALAGRAPLAIVHGGGREIDAETARRGVPKQAIDGLRITDAATLEAVVPRAMTLRAAAVPLKTSWSPGKVPASAHCQIDQFFQLAGSVPGFEAVQ